MMSAITTIVMSSCSRLSTVSVLGRRSNRSWVIRRCGRESGPQDDRGDHAVQQEVALVELLGDGRGPREHGRRDEADHQGDRERQDRALATHRRLVDLGEFDPACPEDLARVEDRADQPCSTTVASTTASQLIAGTIAHPFRRGEPIARVATCVDEIQQAAAAFAISGWSSCAAQLSAAIRPLRCTAEVPVWEPVVALRFGGFLVVDAEEPEPILLESRDAPGRCSERSASGCSSPQSPSSSLLVRPLSMSDFACRSFAVQFHGHRYSTVPRHAPSSVPRASMNFLNSPSWPLTAPPTTPSARAELLEHALRLPVDLHGDPR